MQTLTELRHRLEDPSRRKSGWDTNTGFLAFVPRIECADGMTLSVQASQYHYCRPRNNTGPWHEVEVGFPSRPIAELLPFAEEPDKPTQTVYGYVPIEVVAEVIGQHGGFAAPESLASSF